MLISQGLANVGESVPPLFDPLGEGADEKEVDAIDVSMSSAAQGSKRKGGGASKVMDYIVYLYVDICICFIYKHYYFKL